MTRTIITTKYAESYLNDIPRAEATVEDDDRENSIARKFEREALRAGSYCEVFEYYEHLVSHLFRTFDGCVGSSYLYIFEDGSSVEYRDWEEEWCAWTVLCVKFTGIEVH